MVRRSFPFVGPLWRAPLSRFTACLLLLVAALIWGSTFVAQKWVAMADQPIGSLAFTGARFLLGGLVVLPLAWRETRNARHRLERRHIIGFVACGLALLLGGWTQQLGIRGTTIGNAGFLTGLYVALVPILAWGLFGQRPHWVVWPTVVVCLAGAWLLTGAELGRLTVGDEWILLCSVFWAFQVTLVGVLVSASGRPLTLACTQFLVTGVLGSLAALFIETPAPAVYAAALGELLWAGCLSAGVAFTLQVVAQRYLHPATAAIIMSAESVFAALAGALILDERMSLVQMAGAALILFAILAVEAVPALDARRTAPRGET
ncbi:DMT family transporter [Telmatospirillum sp.]|uniref:DMT family transporter n=1 Tax=Telmatospirillum sp. TaxID=2079197 RepID=UPI00283BE80B|nr:DMT family transporter [Telmatospirillum sp.]MDR3440387.1 DMT family transporter [Telmatospirillum sp.]